MKNNKQTVLSQTKKGWVDFQYRTCHEKWGRAAVPEEPSCTYDQAVVSNTYDSTESRKSAIFRKEQFPREGEFLRSK